jgi:hypothetical protein
LKNAYEGASAVYAIPSAPNISPTRNAIGSAPAASGLVVRPNSHISTRTKPAPRTLLEAPHRMSPATTSPTEIGVRTIASYVPCSVSRVKDPKVVSNAAAVIAVEASSPGARKAT